MISQRLSGLTTSASSVPCSRSRTTDTAMIVMVVCIRSAPISPGTMKSADSWSGLYQARMRTSSRAAGVDAAPAQDLDRSVEARGRSPR